MSSDYQNEEAYLPPEFIKVEEDTSIHLPAEKCRPTEELEYLPPEDMLVEKCRPKHEMEYLPPEFIKVEDEEANEEVTSINMLPERSRQKYEMVYKTFMDWRQRKNIDSFSESVILTYFGELSEKYKSSSLWAHYSMLKSTLDINNSVNISSYTKLRAYLKRKSEGFKAKKAKTFTPEEIHKFITQAPDLLYLAAKVALIMGITGACRASELHSMNAEDVEDLGTCMLVRVPNIKTKTTRKFTITGHFLQYCKKYVDLRPTNNAYSSFFLTYQNGKCTAQAIGINKLGSMGKQIAIFLGLENPEMYTGHSFRMSSAGLVVDDNGEITAVKKRGGWKSVSATEGYNTDDSMSNKIDTEKIALTVQPNTSSYTHKMSATDKNINLDINARHSINISNCSNVTININANNKK